MQNVVFSRDWLFVNEKVDRFRERREPDESVKDRERGRGRWRGGRDKEERDRLSS